MPATVALLTDFNTTDTYVGVMKGVIQTICPAAQMIDLTHAISPQNIRQGAFALLNAYRYFPAGTVFLVVVDPGVGSLRRPVAVQAGDYFFVGPDNGVLSYALAGLDIQARVILNNPNYHLNVVSQTFHGRDIFAPAAAHLAAGVPISELGEKSAQLVDFELPELGFENDMLQAEVAHIDHFGNIITSIGALTWLDDQQLCLKPTFGSIDHSLVVDSKAVSVFVNEYRLEGIKQMYSAGNPGEMMVTVGSNGYLEIAINQGNCAARMGTLIGDSVRVAL